MNILIDTHILIWFSQDAPELNENFKRIIEDDSNTICISIASFWEIAIKKSINKLEMNTSLRVVYEKCIDNGFEIIPVLFNHVEKLEILPYHHRDPFDRIIIAQAIVENLYIITNDNNFSKYNIKSLSV